MSALVSNYFDYDTNIVVVKFQILAIGGPEFLMLEHVYVSDN